MALWMTPGCDLHLIHGTAAPAGVAQTIKMIAIPMQNARDVAADPQTVYTGFNPSVVTVANGTFTPVGVGDTVALVTFTDTAAGNTVHTGYVRVRVHGSLTSLQIANRHITLRAGSANSIPTVFAAFDDLPVADVTGHAWVNVSVGAGASFSVTAGDPLGRLHAPAGTAGTQGVVLARAGTVTSASVPVTVVQELSAERRILNPVRYHGEHTTRRNILFLGEGFPDKDSFERHVLQVVDRMFSSSAYSPYPQLAEHINVWTAFEPSPGGAAMEPGITVGPLVNEDGEPFPIDFNPPSNYYSARDLTALVGLPPGPGSPADAKAARTAWVAIAGFIPDALVDENFNAWKRQVKLAPTAPKDSTFGIIYGNRPGGPLAPPKQPPTTHVPNADAHWELLPALPNVTVSTDPRRLPENADFPGHLNPAGGPTVNAFFQTYLESLKYGIDPNHPDYHVGRVWLNQGADAGLIALLVYDEMIGGTAISFLDVNGVLRRLAMQVSLGNQNSVKLVANTTPRDHTATLEKPVYEQIAAILAHELAHALSLGDEYENIHGDGGSDATGVNAAQFEMSSNLMHASNILDMTVNPHVVKGANIKWNWPRIVIASPLSKDVDPGANGATTIQLEPSQGLKWKTARDKALDVYLRVRELNPGAPQSTWAAPSGPFKIAEITGDTLVLKGPVVSPLVYRAGSVLYQPAMNGTALRTLVDPAVVMHLAQKGPFGINNDPTIPSNDAEDAPKVEGLSKPKHAESVIGIYDGGGTFNTNVFRPAGNCRMRDIGYTTYWTTDWIFHFIPFPRETWRVQGFCFVCKYILVNVIWPGAYDLLDREYPEDC